jgi:hypothetical protein
MYIRRKVFSQTMDWDNGYEMEERLYSTGDYELDEMLERAFCEGYEVAQREFGYIGKGIDTTYSYEDLKKVAKEGNMSLKEARKLLEDRYRNLGHEGIAQRNRELLKDSLKEEKKIMKAREAAKAEAKTLKGKGKNIIEKIKGAPKWAKYGAAGVGAAGVGYGAYKALKD